MILQLCFVCDLFLKKHYYIVEWIQLTRYSSVFSIFSSLPPCIPANIEFKEKGNLPFLSSSEVKKYKWSSNDFGHSDIILSAAKSSLIFERRAGCIGQHFPGTFLKIANRSVFGFYLAGIIEQLSAIRARIVPSL